MKQVLGLAHRAACHHRGMKTHLNLVSEQDRKIADTLKSLSLAAPPRDIATPKPQRRRPAHFFLAVATLATAAGVMAYPSRVADGIGALLHFIPDGAHPNAGAAPAPRQVNLSADALTEEPGGIPAPLPLAREITGSGFVVAPKTTTIFSKYEGRITHISVEPGEHVEKNQVLIDLEDASARFALEQAYAAKAVAELVLAARTIDLVQARTSFERSKTLTASNAASRQAFEDAQTALDQAVNAQAQAQQSIASTELSIRIADEKLAALTIRAPFSGTVTRLDAHVGDMVLARIDSVRESLSLVTLTDTEHLVIDADVAETSIAALKPGLRGEAVLDGFPEHPFAVEILRLAPIASAEKGTITLRLSLHHPPNGIRPNMAARIRIPLHDAGEAAR